MAVQAIKNETLSPKDHQILRLKRSLDIEREMHDKTLAKLAMAENRFSEAEEHLMNLMICFKELTGLTPAEYLKNG